MRRRGNPVDMRIERTLPVRTEVAAWFLFHPDDLLHRRSHPSDWRNHGFALSREFAAGHLVAVGTGSDGTFNVRLTDSAPGERERRYLAHSLDFRLDVRHGRLFLGNDWHLPNGDFWREKELADPEWWVEVPIGRYRVTVSSIAWHEEPGSTDEQGYVTPGALPAYLVQFRRVEDLDGVPAHSRLPRLAPDRRSELVFTAQSREAPPSGRVETEYPLLVLSDQVVFPGFQQSIRLDERVYQDLVTIRRTTRKWSVVVAPAVDSTVGTVFVLTSFGSSSNPGAGHHMIGYGSSVVCLGDCCERDRVRWASVEPLSHGPARAGERLPELLRLFDQHAESDPHFWARVEYPDFEREWIASLTSVATATSAMAQHIRASQDTKLEWLESPPAVRLELLQRFLSGSPLPEAERG